jgi:hypothetical protein
MIESFIKSILKKYIEEEFNFYKVTYDSHGERKKSTEPIKISDGHWVNIHTFKNNEFEIEHIRSISNVKGKTTLDIVGENLEINERLKLELKNKIVQGNIILE